LPQGNTGFGLWCRRVEEAEGRNVKQEISSPHDKLFNQLLGEPENAASFLADNLASEITSHLDLTTLQVVQVSFIDTQFIQSEADLLFWSLLPTGRAMCISYSSTRAARTVS
jgi:hypothetical protein